MHNRHMVTLPRNVLNKDVSDFNFVTDFIISRASHYYNYLELLTLNFRDLIYKTVPIV